MGRATALFRLQGIDTELDGHRTRLKAIETALSDSPEVRAAQTKMVDAQAQFGAARAAAQSLEHDNQAIGEKISQAEARLYSGQVTNPKELQDLEKDLASLRRRRQAIEEQQLEALIKSETAEGRLVATQTELQRTETESAKTNGHLAEEHATLKARVARLESEREATAAPIPPEDQEMYQRLRQSKNGRAVSQLEDGICSTCGVAPSSSRTQVARQGNELVLCSNCGRILYAE